MAVYVDNFSSQEERPARPVRQDETSDLNKTAINKGVWEFGMSCWDLPASSCNA